MLIAFRLDTVVWRPCVYFTVDLLDEAEQTALGEKASSVRYDVIIFLIVMLPKCTHQGRMS